MLTGVPREGSGRFFNLLLVRTMQGRDGKARRVGMLSGSFSHRSRCKGQMQGWGERRHLETPRHRSVREGPRRVCGDRGGRSPRRTPSPVPHPRPLKDADEQPPHHAAQCRHSHAMLLTATAASTPRLLLAASASAPRRSPAAIPLLAAVLPLARGCRARSCRSRRPC